jgi:hypothetical protein
VRALVVVATKAQFLNLLAAIMGFERPDIDTSLEAWWSIVLGANGRRCCWGCWRFDGIILMVD